MAIALISLATLLISASAAAVGELNPSDFSPDFLFGTTTSAYQVEGAYLADGKSLNAWDVITHKLGNILDGSNGDVADDHYHRFREDIELMHSLGVNSYRFSISWSRILPRGISGDINLAGIKFYNELIDALLDRGIQPFVTLHHFDLPYELQQHYGGWLDPGIRKEFVRYAEVCFKSFGDRVKHWTTFNEPNLFVKFAYILGTYPPNRCSAGYGNCSNGNSFSEPYLALHNIILSHATAVHIYKSKYQAKQGGSIGIVACTKWFIPLRDIQADILAAQRAISFEAGWVLDPIFYGDYPHIMRSILGSNLPNFTSEERILLQNYKPDFIGINQYSAIYVQDCLHSLCNLVTYDGNALVYCMAERNGELIGQASGIPGYYVTPKGIEDTLMYLSESYRNVPIYITENGYSDKDNGNLSFLMNDIERMNFLHDYLSSVSSAIRRGANVRGYFVWSLMDNFEWRFGYSLKFGLYHVDFTTLERKPKLSARWYAKFLESWRRTAQLGGKDFM